MIRQRLLKLPVKKYTGGPTIEWLRDGDGAYERQNPIVGCLSEVEIAWCLIQNGIFSEIGDFVGALVYHRHTYNTYQVPTYKN